MIRKLINDSLVSSWGCVKNELKLTTTWSRRAPVSCRRRLQSCTPRSRTKPPSLFLSASRTEKQFITLPDSLSETDTIKNNIKWIMFSSDWYHHNCRPDFCQRGGRSQTRAPARARARTQTHTLWGRGRHTDAAISCLCAWVICPHFPLQMASAS